MSRILITPVALLSGILKVALFPLICAVGVVVMPIIALVRVCQGKKDAGDWLKAWSFSILGLGASMGFIILASYFLPLIGTSALFVLFLSLSIVIHTYKLVKEPNPDSKTFSD